jgi:glyoxylase-like metal-dependent hydrolase (beta-lactamase superfamily II)
LTNAKPDAVRYLSPPVPFGEPVEIAPGILWLRLPLPFALDHVNVWLLDDGDGWTLIDAGVRDDRTLALWQGLLGGALAGKPIRRIIATHFHPDHVGLCGWLAERLDAAFLTSRIEWLQARLLALDATDDYVIAGRRFDVEAGLAPELIEARYARGNRYRQSVSPPPAVYTRLAAGDTIRMAGSDWRVLIGEGHSPEMLTFWSEARNILIAADQILPRISPVVAVWPPVPAADPLAEFLSSLPQYLELPADTLVLPSHDAPYHGLHERVHALVRHHDERCDLTLRACVEPVTLVEIMPKLFRRRFDVHQLGFALGETMAHVNYLLARGRLQVVGERGAARLFRSRRALHL